MRIPVRRLSIRVVVVGVVAAVVAGAVYFVFLADSTKKVTAHFTSAIGIYSGTDVRMMGVKIGKVTSVKPTGNDVVVGMTYDGKYTLPADATAIQVTSSLVEDRFVQLAPVYVKGQPALANGQTIPLTRTAVPAELDQIYSALNTLSTALGPTGANKNGALTDLLNVAAANLQGNGAALGQSITNLSAAARTLADGREDLFGTVKNLQAFSAALVASDAQVRHVNEQLAQVAGDLADERADLGAALKNLGQSLTQIAAFVKTNGSSLHTSLTGLITVTKILVDQKAALKESLALAPVALANLAHTYNQTSGTLDTRTNLNTLTNPTQLCELLPTGSGTTILGVTVPTPDLSALKSECTALLGSTTLPTVPGLPKLPTLPTIPGLQ